ncbi:hypothetical protein ACKDBV_004153 [Klebsiella oxytoca]
MTDITELAQRMKAAAVRAKTATEEYASGHMSVSVCYAECEEFNRLTDGPDNIIALVEALEKAKKSNEFLKGQLSELANFNPDWDKLEASYDSWREIAAELLVAKERISELESRTVKLPENIVDKVCLTAAEIHAQGSGVNDDKAQDIIDRIREILTPAAGIKWEAE